ASVGTLSRLHDGDSLFQAGGRGGGFYVVLSGSVEIVDPSREGSRVIARQGPRQFTGDVDIVTRRRTLVDGVARGETEVLHVPSREIRSLITRRPGLGEVILRAFILRRQLLLSSNFQGLTVIGSGSARDTFRIREFLTRSH